MVDTFLHGCHLSISAGFPEAIEAAASLGATALQLFSHAPSRWAMKPISPESVKAFRSARKRFGLRHVVVHAGYLPNLGSPDAALHARSIASMLEELERAAALGADALVTHLGAHRGAGRARGIARVAAAVHQVTDAAAFREASVALLLENAAGAGTSLGHTFEEMGEILAQLTDERRIGVCLDTCHAFAAGYDLRHATAVADTLDTLDRALGIDRLRLVHLNDAKHPLASRRDRHEHIGSGEIGEQGFAAILRHPALRGLPVILETPKEGPGDAADRRNLATIRRLRNAPPDRAKAGAAE